MKVFSVYDKVAKKFISTSLAETEQQFVQQSFMPLVMDYALIDIDFFCVGDFDTDLGLIKPCQPRLCSWECYKFPEKRDSIKEKYLTVDQIIEAAKSKKNEFIHKTKDKIEDYEKALVQAKGLLKIEEEKDKKDKKRIRELRNYINSISKDIKSLKEIA